MKHFTKIAAIVLMASTSVAFAASPATTTFNVTATVNSQGSLSATNAAFGSISGGNTNVAAAGSFTMAVNTIIQPTITFAPASGAAPYMTLAGSPTVQLPYNLYLPTGGTNTPNVYAQPTANGGTCGAAGPGNTVLSYGAPYNIGVIGVNNSAAYSICAQVLSVPAAQQAGNYSDTVTLTLNY